MKTLKRVLKFDSNDWKHIAFLSRNFFKQFFRGNFNEAMDALYWIKIHFSYDSQLIVDKDTK